MYKIYINETPLYLVDKNTGFTPQEASLRDLILSYHGKKKLLLQVIDQLEKPNQLDSVSIISKDIQRLWTDFKSLFTIIEAAGGLVLNEEQKQLFIFRRGHWDLPKGKIDDGETSQEAAIREVEEETGLQNLTIENSLTDTYHTYHLKGKRVLKKTFWYLMKTSDFKLNLQSEEDIEAGEWVAVGDEKNLGEIYSNILDVVASSRPFLK